VNDFISSSSEKNDVLKMTKKIEQEQVKRVQAFKNKRNQKVTRVALSKLSEAAKGDENLMPHFVSCVEGGATLGEISDQLRDIFGTHKETVTI
jgi:methylmalonyl-CoA mutase N-terminal domain/subunit